MRNDAPSVQMIEVVAAALNRFARLPEMDMEIIDQRVFERMLKDQVTNLRIKNSILRRHRSS